MGIDYCHCDSCGENFPDVVHHGHCGKCGNCYCGSCYDDEVETYGLDEHEEELRECCECCESATKEKELELTVLSKALVLATEKVHELGLSFDEMDMLKKLCADTNQKLHK
ncbi:hypothetical protein AB1283_01135 [Bacillus sp. S13(2024)]|uniref:hypothetical protein n=1 Tax=Bacillus sp. S13(2024) TaxID=3162885 RepID=UPI003D24C444